MSETTAAGLEAVLSPDYSDLSGSVPGRAAILKMSMGERLAKECANLLRTCKLPKDASARDIISKLRCSLERAIGSEVFLGKNLASEVDNLASEVFLAVEKRPEAGHISNPPDRDTSGQWLLPIAKSFATRNDTELQAKCVNVKCWACVNFSCVRGEELLRFLRSLVRMCVNIGMDFSVEPTMLVLDPCPTDIEDSLLNV